MRAMAKRLYVGSYTTAEAPFIKRVSVDTDAVSFTEIEDWLRVGNPIYFALNRARTRLYVTQSGEPEGGICEGGTLAVYDISEDCARLLSLKRFDFTVPCHISLNNAETKLLFAEYTGAHAGVIELDDDGAFTDRVHVVMHEGSGPNKVRQEKAHCHQAVSSPDDKVLFVCDLGIDAIKAYSLEGDSLTALSDCDYITPPGAGPRHMIFAEDDKIAYVLYELDSSVQPLSYEGGKLTALSAPISALPAGFAGESKAAAIRISPSGKWLLASNRGHDSIAAYPICENGTLSSPVISPLIGKFPRDFDFVDGSDIIIVGHKLSDKVALYRFDEASGCLSFADATFDMARPLAFIQ